MYSYKLGKMSIHSPNLLELELNGPYPYPEAAPSKWLVVVLCEYMTLDAYN